MAACHQENDGVVEEEEDIDSLRTRVKRYRRDVDILTMRNSSLIQQRKEADRAADRRCTSLDSERNELEVRCRVAEKEVADLRRRLDSAAQILSTGGSGELVVARPGRTEYPAVVQNGPEEARDNPPPVKREYSGADSNSDGENSLDKESAQRSLCGDDNKEVAVQKSAHRDSSEKKRSKDLKNILEDGGVDKDAQLDIAPSSENTKSRRKSSKRRMSQEKKKKKKKKP